MNPSPKSRPLSYQPIKKRSAKKTDLLPAFLIKNFDNTNLIDLLAIALTIPIAAKARETLPEKWWQLYKT
jgi:hypothetical protein